MCDDGSETLRLLQCDRHGLRWDRHSASRSYTSPLVPTTIHSGLSFINRFSIKLKLSCVGMRCGMICEVEFMVSSHIRRSASSYRQKRWNRAGPFFRPQSVRLGLYTEGTPHLTASSVQGNVKRFRTWSWNAR